MSIMLRATIIVIAIAFSLFNLRLLLRRSISERSTVLWLFGTIIVIIVAVFPQLLNAVAYTLGVDYPPSLLYLIAILVLLTIVMYQSIQLSKLDEKIRKVTQSVALLGEKLDKQSESVVLVGGTGVEDTPAGDSKTKISQGSGTSQLGEAP